MLPRAHQEFERICARRQVRGSVLEVGATPIRATLLCMKSLAHATERIGINLDGPWEFDGFRILQGNANDMSFFPDGRFDAVLCNATLEHDKYFWRTVAEIKRVTRPGGLIAIGTPGYGDLWGNGRLSRWMDSLQQPSDHWSLRQGRRVLNGAISRLAVLRLLYWGTHTYRVHDAPGDYYRFSAQTYREVILDGLDEIEVRTILVPPIIVGAGIKR